MVRLFRRIKNGKKKRGKGIISAYLFEHRFGTSKRLKMRLVSFLSAVYSPKALYHQRTVVVIA